MFMQFDYSLQPEWTFLNHGAFGASIKEGMQLCTVSTNARC